MQLYYKIRDFDGTAGIGKYANFYIRYINIPACIFSGKKIQAMYFHKMKALTISYYSAMVLDAIVLAKRLSILY